MGVFAFGYDAGGRKYFRISHQKDFYQSTQYPYENSKLVNRLKDVKTEKLLSEYELRTQS